MPFNLAGFDLGEVQDVVDKLRQSLTFTGDHIHVFANLFDNLCHFGVTGIHHRKDAVLQSLFHNLGEAQNGGQRRAEFMADGRKEGAFGFIGTLGIRTRLLCFIVERGIVDGHTHTGSNGAEQILVGFIKPVGLQSTLYT